MFDAQLHFDLQPTADLDDVSDAVNHLLGALRLNGQICGGEWPIVRQDSGCSVYILLPAEGGSWRLEEPWHLFDFKCDGCRLLSNIAWDVRG